MAALSCKEPYLVLCKDKVVLHPKASLLTKLVSAFHFNQHIVLPCLCLVTVHQMEISLHCLIVVCVVCVYLSATVYEKY